MRLAIVMAVCVLCGAAFGADGVQKPAWVDKDLIKAYEQVTGKSYEVQIRILTGRADSTKVALRASSQHPSGDTVESGSIDYKLKVLLKVNGNWCADAFIWFEGNILDLEKLDPRVRIPRIRNKIMHTGDFEGVIFPIELLPEVAVFPGVVAVRQPGGIYGWEVPEMKPLIAADTVHRPAYVDPELIESYEKATGKRYDWEVSILTGERDSAEVESLYVQRDGRSSLEAAADTVGLGNVAESGLHLTDDGWYTSVWIRFRGDVPSLESIDPRVQILRIGSVVSRAGDNISVAFPIELLPNISCFPEVVRVLKPPMLVPNLK